jgi:DNA topoisomerase-3
MVTILAEKPDVANKIAAALDKIYLSNGKTVDFSALKANEKAIKAQQNRDGYLKIFYNGHECYVTWGYGHLCTLKQAYDYNASFKNWRMIPLPYIPKNYEIKISTSSNESWDSKVEKQFNTVKELFLKSNLIINATDFDREGEVIFAYIYELTGVNKPVKRACFTSQTKQGIIDGFTKNIKLGEDMKLTEYAGRMRGIADWVVGANLTTAMSLKHPGAGVMSVGRVQTPTLYMIVERELAIQNFEKKPYWAIEALFTTDKTEQFKAKHSVEKIFDKSEAEELFEKVNGHKGIVSDISKKRVKKEPPLLYSLSALQMDANSKFGYTLDKTLECVQKLYDGGFTTYPRTNSQYLTEDMEPVVNSVLDKLSSVSIYKPLIDGRPRVFDRKHYFDNKKVESHFAIIPTGNIPKGLPTDQKQIFDLICRSMIKMLYGAATLEQTKVSIDVNGEEFKANGSVIVEPGWMAVGDASKTELLPDLKKGEVLDGEYKLCDKMSEPPKRFTDKTILAAMLSAGKDLDDAELKKLMSDPKTGGIGTEATRAAIIDTLIQRGYIVREKKIIRATQKGIDLIAVLPLGQIKSPELTAKWERRLADIARGEEDPSVFQRDFEAVVRNWVNVINKKVDYTNVNYDSILDGVACPLCGKPINIIGEQGYICSDSKNGCRFKIGTVFGKKITENQLKKLCKDKQTELIKGFKNKDGSKFNAKLVIENGSLKFEYSSK